MMGWFRRISEDAVAVRRVLHELRVIREDTVAIRQQLQRTEQTMVSNSRLLFTAIAAAESKLDGYASIITANAQAMRDAQAALLALKDEPTTAEVQQVITDLGTHLSAVDTAVANITSSPVPAAPTDGTTPIPAPAVLPDAPAA